MKKPPRAYKGWNADGFGAERMVDAMLLVLGETPISARMACKKVFGDKFPNVHRTLGNLYQRKFDASIASAKRLSSKARQERRSQLQTDGIDLPKPGNPDWKPYLTADEELLICSFLTTCNYMHMVGCLRECWLSNWLVGWLVGWFEVRSID